MKSITAWPHPITYEAIRTSGDSRIRTELTNKATGFHTILTGRVATAKTPDRYDRTAIL